MARSVHLSTFNLVEVTVVIDRRMNITPSFVVLILWPARPAIVTDSRVDIDTAGIIGHRMHKPASNRTSGI